MIARRVHRINAITVEMTSIRIRSQLNKLLSPIQDCCASKVKHCWQNNYTTSNIGTDNYAKNIKCKNMPPKKIWRCF